MLLFNEMKTINGKRGLLTVFPSITDGLDAQELIPKFDWTGINSLSIKNDTEKDFTLTLPQHVINKLNMIHIDSVSTIFPSNASISSIEFIQVTQPNFTIVSPAKFVWCCCEHVDVRADVNDLFFLKGSGDVKLNSNVKIKRFYDYSNNKSISKQISHYKALKQKHAEEGARRSAVEEGRSEAEGARRSAVEEARRSVVEGARLAAATGRTYFTSATAALRAAASRTRYDSPTDTVNEYNHSASDAHSVEDYKHSAASEAASEATILRHMKEAEANREVRGGRRKKTLRRTKNRHPWRSLKKMKKTRCMKSRKK